MRNTNADNGIYYFLGNITSHILHALPLHKEIGGTFVVLSEKAKREVEAYDVPVIALNNRPREWRRFGYRIKPVYHYLDIDERQRKTVELLNDHAKVVIFYELYNFAPSVRLTKPKTVFLTHGNMLKDYMGANNRLETLKQYDYMAALGPYLKKQFIERDGIDPAKLIDVGIARTDEIVKHGGEVYITDELIRETGLDPRKKIVSYLPTFWGPSSIYGIGKEIVRNFPDEYTLIFRPHPQTPKKLLREYLNIIKHKQNVIYAPEGAYKHLGLIDIFNACSAIIGDVSSVMLEAIFIEKPLLFAYEDSQSQQFFRDCALILNVVKHSQIITSKDPENIKRLVDDALASGIKKNVWVEVQRNNFFHFDGRSTNAIADFVVKFMR